MLTLTGVFVSLRRSGAGRLAGVALALCIAAAPGAGQAEGRVALVIGNAAYSELQPLANPVNDANGIAAALERLGFEVTLVTDAPRDQLAPVMEAFTAEAEGAETVLFYYSGHAFQQDGQNLLVPSDAALKSPEALTAETWSFSDDIVARLAGEGRQGLFFLDACRNNPLPESTAFAAWHSRWQARSPSAAIMLQANPAIIPRNHRVEEAIQAAVAGDLAPSVRLITALATPYDPPEGTEDLRLPPEPHEVVQATFCGT